MSIYSSCTTQGIHSTKKANGLGSSTEQTLRQKTVLGSLLTLRLRGFPVQSEAASFFPRAPGPVAVVKDGHHRLKALRSIEPGRRAVQGRKRENKQSKAKGQPKGKGKLPTYLRCPKRTREGPEGFPGSCLRELEASPVHWDRQKPLSKLMHVLFKKGFLYSANSGKKKRRRKETTR